MKQQDVLKKSFLHFLRILGDLMVVNLLWFFCSLPIITVGPATCGMYTVLLKLARKEQTSTIKDFFRAFKDNVKAGFVIGILVLVLALVTYVDANFAANVQGTLQTVYIVVAAVMGAIALTIFCYAFAVQAMFENPLKVQLKNAFSLAFVNPGKTVMMWLITAFPVLVAIALPQFIVARIGFIYLIMGVSGPAYLNSRLLRDIFDKVNGSPIVSAPEDEE